MENTLKMAKTSSQQFHNTLHRLSKIIRIFLYTCYTEVYDITVILSKIILWVLLWGKGISELRKFPFISKFRIGFETQLMLQNVFPWFTMKWGMWTISIEMRGEKDESL